MKDEQVLSRWFGDFTLEEGGAAYWRIGPLQLWIRHGAGEWRVEHQHGDDPWLTDMAVQFSAIKAVPAAQEAVRYVLADRSGHLHLQPLLPDRTVVSRPAEPVQIPAGEAVKLYVSVPLWVRIAVGPQRKELVEIPTLRPSDTWFGPSNMVGELCYAMRTRCRVQLDPAELLPYRATVPVTIRNHSTKVLGLERLGVPVRQLGLFVTEAGEFWTEEVALDRHENGGGFAALRIAGGAPAEAGNAESLSASRDVPQRKTVIHAFSSLFG